MKPTYLLGIDIGTQGTKGVLVDVHGRVRGTGRCKSRLVRPGPGAVEEDPEYQFRAVCRCIRVCIESAKVDPAHVAGVGIDGQMAGLLGIGGDGRHVTPYDSWLDTRCSDEIVRMKREAGEEVIRKTGGPPSFNHGPKILWWKRRHPDVYRRISAFVQPGAYAAMRLCKLGAADAFIDTSYLHFSGFADNVRGQWDPDLCRTFGVATAKLPRIVEPQAVVGGVGAGVASRCGLKAGTPVVAGCGDTAASFLACGATREGICVDVAGTASVFAATTRSFRADVEQGLLGWGRSATPGLWHPYAYINGGGMNVEWFAAELAAARPGSRLAVDRLNREQVTAVLVDLKRRIDGDFFVIEESEDRIVLGNRRCPFGDAVRDRPSLCMMTSNVFGFIAAQNLGYAAVDLQQTIAAGHPTCRVVVSLKPAAHPSPALREYFQRDDMLG